MKSQSTNEVIRFILGFNYVPTQLHYGSGEIYFYRGRSEFTTYPNYLTLGLSLHFINNKFLPFKPNS